MRILIPLLGLSTLALLALACGGGGSSSAAATTGTSTLTGTINKAVLSGNQYTGNTQSYTVTATQASTSTNTTGTLFVDSNDTVNYNVGTLLASTEYDITVWKGAGGSNTVLAQVTATTEASGSSKPRSAADDTTFELNTFSTFYTSKVQSLRASGNSNPAFFAKFELFPFSTASNITDFSEIEMSNGIATMTVSGNKQALTPNAKANASIKFLTQVAKSVVYMSDDTLVKQAGNLSSMLDRAATTSSMNEITELYTDDDLGFSELMKDITEDLPAGTSFGNIIAEIDPVLANMDFIEAIDTTDFSGGAGALDTLFETQLFASAENLTKTMYSYELALETFTRDIPEFTYDIDTELFFEDFDEEFAGDAGFSISDWTTEAMGDLSDIFDADFDDGSDDFNFTFDSDDLTYLYADLSNEILDVLSEEDGFDVSTWDDAFDAIDFGEGFEDLDFELGVLDEDLLATALGGSSTNISILDVRLAHPTYGTDDGPGGNMILSSLAPVFKVQLLPSAALAANVALAEFAYGDVLQIRISQNGNLISIGNSILTSSFEDDSFYIAYHKGAYTDLASNELMPGEDYEYELVAGDGVDFFDFDTEDLSGTFSVRDITFTLPFDGVQSTSTQVNLPWFVPEFFEIDIEAPDKTEFLKDIDSSVFDAEEVNGSLSITGAKLTLVSGILSDDGTYELKVSNGDQLTWDEGGQTMSVPAGSYQSRQFFDVLMDQSFLLDEDLLSIEGTDSGTASPLSTATPSIYIHSAYGITANSGVSDYGLFGTDMLSLQALNHSEAIDFSDDFELPTAIEGLTFELLVGSWVDETDSDHVLTFNDDGSYTETSDSGTTTTGTWDVVAGLLIFNGATVDVSLSTDLSELSTLNPDGTVDTVWVFDLDGSTSGPGDITDPTTGTGNLTGLGDFVMADNIIGDWTEITDGNVLMINDDFTWTESNAAGVETDSGQWEIISGNVYVDGELEIITFNGDYTGFSAYDEEGNIDATYILSSLSSSDNTTGSDNTTTTILFDEDDLIGDWTESQSGNLLTISSNNFWSESDVTGQVSETGTWEIISGNLVIDGETEMIEFESDYSSFSVLFEDGTVDQVWNTFTLP